MPSALPKALLLTQIYPPAVGGSGRWFYEIYRRLPHASTVVFTEPHPEARPDAQPGPPVIRQPFNLRDTGGFSPAGCTDYARLARRVDQACRQHDVQVLHCGRCLPEGWIGWRLRRTTGRRFVCFAHGEEVNRPARRGDTGVMSSRQHRLMGRWSLGAADLVIANSHNTARILFDQWGLSQERVAVLHPGCDLQRFRPADPDPEVRRAWGWHDRLVLLTVGRLQARKGHDHLIAALPALRQAVPHLLYAIVGRGEEAARLRALADQYQVAEAVRFYEDFNDDDLTTAYQQCDLFVLPNRQIGSDLEGFGMVLVEAQACGKPVVAGASGGTAETLDPDRTGLTLPADTPEQLVAGLMPLVTDPTRLRRYADNARDWVQRHFDWDHLAGRAAELFARVGS